MFSKNANLIALSLLTFFSLGCTTTYPSLNVDAMVNSHYTAPHDLKDHYTKLSKSGGTVFNLVAEKSLVKIYAFRGGRAAKFGHNHVLSAPQFIGYFFLPVDGTAAAQFDLEFRLDQLEIDRPAYRASLGKAFDSELSPDAISGVREHMLGNSNLQAERFPFVRIHSTRIAGETPKFAVNIQVELHGQTREMWVPLNVDGLPDRLSATGSFVLRQSEFGAQPYSIMGGLIAVQDEVVIEFELVGSPLNLAATIQ